MDNRRRETARLTGLSSGNPAPSESSEEVPPSVTCVDQGQQTRVPDRVVHEP